AEPNRSDAGAFYRSGGLSLCNRLSSISLLALNTGRLDRFQPGQHCLKLLPYSRHYRINVNAALSGGADLDGLADFNRCPKRPVNMDLVGEILLVPLHCLQHLLGRRLLPEVLRWIEGDLLCEIGVRKLPPATHPFLLGNIACHHVRKDGDADGPDSGRGFTWPLAVQPFLFQWHKEPVNEAVQALAQRAGLLLSEVYHFLKGEQGQSHLCNSFEQWLAGQ